MAHLDISKGVDLPLKTTQSLPYCCITRRTTLQNIWSKTGWKYIATNLFQKNGISALPRNDRWWFPSLSHQKIRWISPEIPRLPWRCSNLKSTMCRIWIRRNRWPWEMTSLPLWCNRKRRTKRRNWWRKNSGPWHQHRQGRLCFLFSVYFPCTIFFSLPYPRTWASPQR